uniref:Uncharacterized protein n=1 Tax=Pipistrellus kuhlii TaxID=59472 RepID=A0A7J7VMK4_PIPKU|nr:hypothetical protein mPipKuh1_008397 [Pipistrellus kuhlii]
MGTAPPFPDFCLLLIDLRLMWKILVFLSGLATVRCEKGLNLMPEWAHVAQEPGTLRNLGENLPPCHLLGALRRLWTFLSQAAWTKARVLHSMPGDKSLFFADDATLAEGMCFPHQSYTPDSLYKNRTVISPTYFREVFIFLLTHRRLPSSCFLFSFLSVCLLMGPLEFPTTGVCSFHPCCITSRVPLVPLNSETSRELQGLHHLHAVCPVAGTFHRWP